MKNIERTLSVDAAVRQLREGRMLLICDDESREHEADLCVAAQFATPEVINFCIRNACGLLCVALTGERLDELYLPLAPKGGGVCLNGPAFAASVDAVHGVTSGISAHDRAVAIRALVDPSTRPNDLTTPGHVFPLRARPNGTLERRGHTEASVDLMKMAGLYPAAVICEVLDEEGHAARNHTLMDFAERWDLDMITVDAIVNARSQDAAGNMTAALNLK